MIPAFLIYKAIILYLDFVFTSTSIFSDSEPLDTKSGCIKQNLKKIKFKKSIRVIKNKPKFKSDEYIFIGFRLKNFTSIKKQAKIWDLSATKKNDFT